MSDERADRFIGSALDITITPPPDEVELRADIFVVPENR
jgi:hypothetical protein